MNFSHEPLHMWIAHVQHIRTAERYLKRLPLRPTVGAYHGILTIRRGVSPESVFPPNCEF